MLMLMGLLLAGAALAAAPPKSDPSKAEAAKKEFKDNKDIVQSLAGLVALLTGVVTLLPKALESVTLVSRRRRDLQRIDELTSLTQKVQAEGVLSLDTSARIKQAIEAELLLAAETLERTRQRRSVRADDQERNDLSFARRFFVLFQPMCWRGIVAQWLTYVCVLGSLAVAYGLGQAWPDPELRLDVQSGTLSNDTGSLQVKNASFQFPATPKQHAVQEGTLLTEAGALQIPSGQLILPSWSAAASEPTAVTGTLKLPEGNLNVEQATLSWAFAESGSSFKWSEFMDYGGWLFLLIGVSLGAMFRAWALRLHDQWRRQNPQLNSQDMELGWAAKLTLGFRPQGWRAWLAHAFAYGMTLVWAFMVYPDWETAHLATDYLAILGGLVFWSAPWWLWALLERWRSVQRARSAQLVANLQLAD